MLEAVFESTPYPSSVSKRSLAQQSGTDVGQISNWVGLSEYDQALLLLILILVSKSSGSCSERGESDTEAEAEETTTCDRC